MRLALVAVLAASCASPEDGRSPLAPSEFHLFGSRSWADADGDIGPRGDPNWNLDTSSSSDGWSLGAGFTWLIGAPASSPAMRELVREMKIARASALVPGAPFRVDVPVAVTVQPVPAGGLPPDAGDTVGAPDPDHVHDPGQGPSGPVPVTVEGANDSIWIPLIGSLSLLATAVAGYLGRERIPVVRRYTAKGRDDAHLAALEAELAEMQGDEAE